MIKTIDYVAMFIYHHMEGAFTFDDIKKLTTKEKFIIIEYIETQLKR